MNHLDQPQVLYSYRQTQLGDWLVFRAIPATYGPGINRVGDPAPGFTTGAQHNRFDTEAEAVAEAHRLAATNGEVVEYAPPQRNPQFVDLPRQYPNETTYETLSEASADGWININPSKTVHYYKGHVIYVRDVTPGASYGYNLAIAVKGQDPLFAESREIWANTHPGRLTGVFSIRFRTGDVVDAIRAACKYIDSIGTIEAGVIRLK
jgi:hypothetical protein